MQERFTALADILSSGSYDVVVLQEVWLEQYYNIIKDAMPYVSPFRCVYVHFSKNFHSYQEADKSDCNIITLVNP